MAFSYTTEAPIPVRDDIPAAHRKTWERIASPGCWWTGAERVAIAAEVRAARDCALCDERKKALSPYGYSGSGFGKYKAPRAFLKDEKAGVLKAYGLDTLPGQ